MLHMGSGSVGAWLNTTNRVIFLYLWPASPLTVRPNQSLFPGWLVGSRAASILHKIVEQTKTYVHLLCKQYAGAGFLEKTV